MKIYIAGPMRGHPRFNFPAFDNAAKQLRDLGHEPVSPADLDREIGFDPDTLPADHDWNDIDSLRFDLKAAVLRDVAAIVECDGLYLLSGSSLSKGAMAELHVARWLGIPAYESLRDIPGAVKPETDSTIPIVDYRSEVKPKESILDEAKRITAGDRQAQYGPPDQDFKRTAKMWSAIKGVEFSAREVAMFMIALKLSRETHQKKRDNPVDIAGYAHCLSVCQECEA